MLCCLRNPSQDAEETGGGDSADAARGVTEGERANDEGQEGENQTESGAPAERWGQWPRRAGRDRDGVNADAIGTGEVGAALRTSGRPFGRLVSALVAL